MIIMSWQKYLTKSFWQRIITKSIQDLFRIYLLYLQEDHSEAKNSIAKIGFILLLKAFYENYVISWELNFIFLFVLCIVHCIIINIICPPDIAL